VALLCGGPKALQTFMVHANISITLDRYGHLMPGSAEQAGALLDSYLDAERGRAGKPGRSAEPQARGTMVGQ
jgi:hypothetical protein